MSGTQTFAPLSNLWGFSCGSGSNCKRTLDTSSLLVSTRPRWWKLWKVKMSLAKSQIFIISNDVGCFWQSRRLIGYTKNIRNMIKCPVSTNRAISVMRIKEDVGKNVLTKWCVKIRKSVISTITESFPDTLELAMRTKSYWKEEPKIDQHSFF